MDVVGRLSDGSKDEVGIPALEDCVYTSCYCEENVWMLCDRVRRAGPEELASCHAVFISNCGQAIPLWCQRAAKDKETGLVLWDYHVVFIAEARDGVRVYDFDTTLPFPCDFRQYVRHVLKSDEGLKSEYHRVFRVIPASLYLQSFASDRSHMRDGAGAWLKPPPNYPCIRSESATNNLSDFISMDVSVGLGDVLTLAQFTERFGRETSSPKPVAKR